MLGFSRATTRKSELASARLWAENRPKKSLIASLTILDIIAQIALESILPERNMPSG